MESGERSDGVHEWKREMMVAPLTLNLILNELRTDPQGRRKKG
jgi:hypothetical protein